jgi:hypothetical protein
MSTIFQVRRWLVAPGDIPFGGRGKLAYNADELISISPQFEALASGIAVPMLCKRQCAPWILHLLRSWALDTASGVVPRELQMHRLPVSRTTSARAEHLVSLLRQKLVGVTSSTLILIDRREPKVMQLMSVSAMSLSD